jgi:hypothetical protein
MLNWKRITASSNAVLTGVYKIDRVRLVSGSDAATAILFDAVTQGSAGDANDFCKLLAGTGNDVDKEDFKHDALLSRGLSVTLTGTNPQLYIYYS